ncbi:uncharacterized protein LOC143425926 [Xylocopa sonorina]|uniref:uncharacterized protein LOC143425926 n=1 Tax=Xylocopa sonorina TaxID=1818115 RepID=UPI00403AFC1C
MTNKKKRGGSRERVRFSPTNSRRLSSCTSHATTAFASLLPLFYPGSVPTYRRATPQLSLQLLPPSICFSLRSYSKCNNSWVLFYPCNLFLLVLVSSNISFFSFLVRKDLT